MKTDQASILPRECTGIGSCMPQSEEWQGDIPALQVDLAAAQRAFEQLSADFEAYKARSRSGESVKAEVEIRALFAELFPVIDGLQAVLANAGPTEGQKLRQEIKVALFRLDQLLSKRHIELVEDVGKPFDPLRHEIVANECDRTRPENIVIRVVMAGYQQGDVVLRPAKVVVNCWNGKGIGDGS